MKIKNVILLVVFFSHTFFILLNAQDIGLAKELYHHNLKSKALELFIDIFHNSKSASSNRAEALFYMGQISFDEGRYSIALKDWQRLIKEYPTNQKAIEIKDRIEQLREVFAKASDASITSTIAQSYIKNGDFWSDADDMKFSIEGSWLSKIDLAIQWYDMVISEFPGSDGAEIAFQRKLFTLIGWKESGQYGIISNYLKYMPILLKTFTDFELSFPNNSYLQGFRYQISQIYWRKKEWDKTREWLNKIIEVGKDHPSFYTETAKARLKKIEY